MVTLNNRAGYVTVNGTAEDDNIYNSTGADYATVYGAAGNDSIHNWGDDAVLDGGDGNDIVYNGEDAEDVTVLTGAGDDTVENWGETITINPGSGSNLVRIYGTDYYTEFNLDASAGLTKVGREIDYDRNVNRFVGVGSATLDVESYGDAAVWLNGWDGKNYTGIRALDGEDIRGSAILAGSDSNEVIIGGESSSSLWGNNGDDTLIGGDGRNEFFYLYNNGADVIENAHDNDVINLLNIGLEEINFNDIQIASDSIRVGFNDGGSLTVNSSKDVVFQLNNGVGFKSDRRGGWSLA